MSVHIVNEKSGGPSVQTKVKTLRSAHCYEQYQMKMIAKYLHPRFKMQNRKMKSLELLGYE